MDSLGNDEAAGFSGFRCTVRSPFGREVKCDGDVLPGQDRRLCGGQVNRQWHLALCGRLQHHYTGAAVTQAQAFRAADPDGLTLRMLQRVHYLQAIDVFHVTSTYGSCQHASVPYHIEL